MPRVPFFIAFRYLFAKKSAQAINIIAGVSLLGFSIGVFAMIVVLSTMNGFEQLVFGMYNDFSPDIRVAPIEGKVISPNAKLEDFLKQNEASFSPILEENAACYYSSFQHIARIKGVDDAYLENANLMNHMVDGDLPESINADTFYGLLGLGVDYRLATRIEDPNCIIQINAPKRGDFNLNSMDAIEQRLLKPMGVFAYDDAINNKYILVSLRYAQALFDRPNQFSFYDIYALNGQSKDLLKELKAQFGEKYEIKSRYELHEGLFKMFKTEKWFTFIILAFVLFIVSFNLTGSLSLLVIEKKKDIKTFKSIGMTLAQVRRIFFLEGLLISLLGAFLGLLVGLVFCFAQIKYGFIKISGAIVESYPMQVRLLDVILCAVLVIVIGILASIYPALKAGKYHA